MSNRTKSEIAHLTREERAAEIDLGLAIFHDLYALPGVSYDLGEIAAWCGCTDSAVLMIEKKAILNIKKKLGEKCLRDLLEEVMENRHFSPGRNASVIPPH